MKDITYSDEKVINLEIPDVPKHNGVLLISCVLERNSS